jgi:hypothetical protein
MFLWGVNSKCHPWKGFGKQRLIVLGGQSRQTCITASTRSVVSGGKKVRGFKAHIGYIPRRTQTNIPNMQKQGMAVLFHTDSTSTLNKVHK